MQGASGEQRGCDLVEDDVGVVREVVRVVREVLENVPDRAERDGRVLPALVVPAPDLVPHPRPEFLARARPWV